MYLLIILLNINIIYNIKYDTFYIENWLKYEWAWIGWKLDEIPRERKDFAQDGKVGVPEAKDISLKSRRTTYEINSAVRTRKIA